MSLVEELQNCTTPQQALLLLAKEIDALRELIRQPAAADPWEQPLQWPENAGSLVTVSRETERLAMKPAPGPAVGVCLPADGLAARIEAVRTKLAETHDPDDQRALTAELRLLRDAAGERVYDSNSGGGGVIPGVPEGKRATVTSSDGKGTVDVVPVSAERKAARRKWATERELWNFLTLEQAAAVDGYAEGGPMWLYLGNRAAVMAMPFGYRQELVEEIGLDSAAEAQEAGRDILKSQDSTDQAITVAAINGLSAARG